MKNLEITFKQSFGYTLPQSLLPQEKLLPLAGDPEESLLFGSPSAVLKPFLVQGDIKSFIESGPEGYFLIGFWGHGVNSYIAFEESILGKISSFIAIESMDEGYYRVVSKEGKTIELKESLFCNPEFEEMIKRGKDA